MSSSVCRLPFISSSPLASRISSTAFAAAASLCGASTISKRPMSRPCSRATAAIFAAGPTRIGTMMPASAASTAPRSEVSSHGCTTIVGAGGTSFARAISRSYFARGGVPSGPIAAMVPMVPISLSLSVGMRHCLRHVPAKAALDHEAVAKGDRTRASCVVDAEQPRDLMHSRLPRRRTIRRARPAPA